MACLPHWCSAYMVVGARHKVKVGEVEQQYRDEVGPCCSVHAVLCGGWMFHTTGCTLASALDAVHGCFSWWCNVLSVTERRSCNSLLGPLRSSLKGRLA